MKKEWKYFIAGAGLAIISVTILTQGDNYSSQTECAIREGQKYQSSAEPQHRLITIYCAQFS
jgi:hypothetical protein